MSESSKPDYAASAGDVPVISIGMPIFNAGRYLRKAVLSILQQTFSRWELIIIDDASIDAALATIQDLYDPRIRIVRGADNRGLAARLNEAVGLASGRYFARMDQDDISHPERLARQLAFLESQPGVDVLGARCLLIDGEDRVSGLLEFPEQHEEVCRRPWRGILMPHPTWMGKTEWFRNHPYRSPGPYFCEDQELLLRTHRSSRFAVLPEALLAYRVKGPVPARKLFRTRTTLAALQCKNFLSHGELPSALKAAVLFAGKCVHDFLAPWAGRPARSANGGVSLVQIPDQERERWRKVLPGLS
jgi:glycosyltransferase involved in cell wall biosynthesis